MIAFIYQLYAAPHAMKKIFQRLLLLTLFFSFPSVSWSLNDSQVEDLADIEAVFTFLKKDCGYSSLPTDKIQQSLIVFAKHNGWDTSNYNAAKMNKLTEESYKDLSGIAINKEKKCNALASRSLRMIAYTTQ